ncbi:MAG: aminotransferase class I/II-fold pyridoxal phosphate-dependent enzyme [Thermoflexales bacterium]|nr:aminotransferase class I/II-fold pyridoxal phosphate-dependent enzyme [Thermoflexales bacterium]
MQSPRTSYRTQRFPESLIREMTRVALQVGAINLSQGYPDFSPPQAIKDAAVKAIEDDWNQYSVTWGLRPLREAIAEHYRRHYEMDVDPDKNIVVCCGATESMLAAMLGVVNPGDEVILFEPYYESYLPNCHITQSIPHFVSLRPPVEGQQCGLAEPGQWWFDPDELRNAFNERTKAIIVNSPHNPTGKVFNEAELRLIAELCQRFDVIAITDEIYEFITYDGARHIPLATLPGMADRTITISGMSKTFSVTGWRLGYAIATEDLMTATRKAHDFMSVCAATPLQVAAITMLTMGDEYYAQLRAEYRERRDFALEMLREVGFKPVVPRGAYYIMADFSELSDEDDVRFAMRLAKEIGVACVPGSPFFSRLELARSVVRFAFCKKMETLAMARERLQRLRR